MKSGAASGTTLWRLSMGRSKSVAKRLAIQKGVQLSLPIFKRAAICIAEELSPEQDEYLKAAMHLLVKQNVDRGNIVELLEIKKIKRVISFTLSGEEHVLKKLAVDFNKLSDAIYGNKTNKEELCSRKRKQAFLLGK